MAIPKKGSRSITVDGRKYRWLVRGKPTYSQACGWTNLSVAVSCDTPASSTLVAKMMRNRPDSWIEPNNAPVTPGDVASVIRHAINAGWRPEEPGKQFDVSVEMAVLRPAQVQANNSLERQ